MTKKVNRLKRDGLVARTPSAEDRRRVGVSLTEEGQRVLRRVRSRRTAWLAQLLRALGPEELAAAAAALAPLPRLVPQAPRRAPPRSAAPPGARARASATG